MFSILYKYEPNVRAKFKNVSYIISDFVFYIYK